MSLFYNVNDSIREPINKALSPWYSSIAPENTIDAAAEAGYEGRKRPLTYRYTRPMR